MLSFDHMINTYYDELFWENFSPLKEIKPSFVDLNDCKIGPEKDCSDYSKNMFALNCLEYVKILFTTHLYVI